jgi:hypothetical protein
MDSTHHWSSIGQQNRVIVCVSNDAAAVGFITENHALLNTFAIDSTDAKTITIAHTPPSQDRAIFLMDKSDDNAMLGQPYTYIGGGFY